MPKCGACTLQPLDTSNVCAGALPTTAVVRKTHRPPPCKHGHQRRVLHQHLLMVRDMPSALHAHPGTTPTTPPRHLPIPKTPDQCKTATHCMMASQPTHTMLPATPAAAVGLAATRGSSAGSNPCGYTAITGGCCSCCPQHHRATLMLQARAARQPHSEHLHNRLLHTRHAPPLHIHSS
jgi:hypothetical protein